MSAYRLSDLARFIVITLFIAHAFWERYIKGDHDNAVWHLLLAIAMLLLDQDILRDRDRGKP